MQAPASDEEPEQQIPGELPGEQGQLASSLLLQQREDSATASQLLPEAGLGGRDSGQLQRDPPLAGQGHLDGGQPQRFEGRGRSSSRNLDRRLSKDPVALLERRTFESGMQRLEEPFGHLPARKVSFGRENLRRQHQREVEIEGIADPGELAAGGVSQGPAEGKEKTEAQRQGDGSPAGPAQEQEPGDGQQEQETEGSHAGSGRHGEAQSHGDGRRALPTDPDRQPQGGDDEGREEHIRHHQLAVEHVTRIESHHHRREQGLAGCEKTSSEQERQPDHDQPEKDLRDHQPRHPRAGKGIEECQEEWVAGSPEHLGRSRGLEGESTRDPRPLETPRRGEGVGEIEVEPRIDGREPLRIELVHRKPEQAQEGSKSQNRYQGPAVWLRELRRRVCGLR